MVAKVVPWYFDGSQVLLYACAVLTKGHSVRFAWEQRNVWKTMKRTVNHWSHFKLIAQIYSVTFVHVAEVAPFAFFEMVTGESRNGCFSN